MSDRNASSSVNGWIFQICVGAYLFFDDLKDNKTLKIEGPKEDVEIVGKSNKKYIQVKCLENINNRNTVYSHYTKALDSLKECDDGETNLIYFSNIRDPFSVSDTNYYDFGAVYSFSELTATAQTKIKNRLGEDFSYDKLKVQIVNYYGDKESKRKFLEDKIAKFLSSIGESESKKSMIYDRIVTVCFENAPNRTKKISKKEFVLNIIIPFLNQNIDYDTFVRITGDSYYDECLNFYEQYLYSYDLDYSLFLKITGEYSRYKSVDTQNKLINFIHDNYINYLDLLPNSVDSDIASGVVKMLIYRIINKNKLLINITKEAGL